MSIKIYLTQSQVMQDRGWSRTMIDKFMSYPCKRETNHINPKYSQLKKYELRRIMLVEESETFQKAMTLKMEGSARIKRRRDLKYYGI